MRSSVLPRGASGPLAAGPAAAASITRFDFSRLAYYTQDGGGVSPDSFYLLSSVESSDSSPDGTTLTYPGPRSPWRYFRSGRIANLFGLFDVAATRADLDAAYRFGTYTATLTSGGIGIATATIHYTQDLTPGVIPALTSATFQGLQGLAPSRAFTLAFNSFTPDPLASASSTYLEVFDQNLGSVLSVTLSPSATGYFLPANTLRANARYSLGLLFANSIAGTDGTAATSQTFLLATVATFATATVP
jgi:hypothetical protein